MTRGYRLGRRQASVDRTGRAILSAARELVSLGPASGVSVGAIARRAGVSRVTVYNRFGGRSGLLAALSPTKPPIGSSEAADPREALHEHLTRTCTVWAGDPALHRHLPDSGDPDPEIERRLAERLAAADALRPGCSLREAEDAIAALGSFSVFDRLHRDGRRSPTAVAEILMRLASGILA